jgi:hypothetical protein
MKYKTNSTYYLPSLAADETLMLGIIHPQQRMFFPFFLFWSKNTASNSFSEQHQDQSPVGTTTTPPLPLLVAPKKTQAKKG